MAMVPEAQNEASHRHHSNENDNIHRALEHYIFQYELNLHCHPFSFYDALVPIPAYQPNIEHLQYPCFTIRKLIAQKDNQIVPSVF